MKNSMFGLLLLAATFVAPVASASPISAFMDIFLHPTVLGDGTLSGNKGCMCTNDGAGEHGAVCN